MRTISGRPDIVWSLPIAALNAFSNPAYFSPAGDAFASFN